MGGALSYKRGTPVCNTEGLHGTELSGGADAGGPLQRPDQYELASEPLHISVTSGTASERTGNNLKGFKGFYQKATARIWP